MSTNDDRGRVATIFDVARLAGVSHQTVSRVLNDLPNVRPATRERVEQAIKQLRYVPSQAANAAGAWLIVSSISRSTSLRFTSRGALAGFSAVAVAVSSRAISCVVTRLPAVR